MKNVNQLILAAMLLILQGACCLLILPSTANAQQPSATSSASPTPATTDTYTIYGGLNPHDSIAADWTAGSDNVTWDFGQTKIVYRKTKSLSLVYNPGGEFHIIKSTPLDISGYEYLSFTGRTESNGLGFAITFIGNNNRPIGSTLSFSRYGGDPADNYWTQYNFPISSFRLPVTQIRGIRISQQSQAWGAVLYLDEIYISKSRGEDINPALPTPTPTIDPGATINPLKLQYFPEFNPVLILIPLIVLAAAIFFH